MANKELLQKLGIKVRVKPSHEVTLDSMTNKEAINTAIDTTYRRGRTTEILSTLAGFPLFVDGLYRSALPAFTNREFGIYPILEVTAGMGLLYLRSRLSIRRTLGLHDLAHSLTNNYVKE